MNRETKNTRMDAARRPGKLTEVKVMVRLRVFGGVGE